MQLQGDPTFLNGSYSDYAQFAVRSRTGGLDDLHRQARADGTPAEPPTIENTVTNWRVGDTIPIRRDRTLRVVGIVVSNADEPSVLIVEDVSR